MSDLCCEQQKLLINLRKKKQNLLYEIQQIKDELCEVAAEMESLDFSQEDLRFSNKEKQMQLGRKKFNMDPKKGIEYLVINNLLKMNAKDIALFLYKGEGLNKTAIGDYLGEKNEFNEQVLKSFVELHDFTNLILVQHFDNFCGLFDYPVKEKPSVDQFISMNRGINNGGDLSRGLLESLYESIRTEPFKIPQDDGNDLMHTFFNPDKEGWLWKQGGRYKSWKRRWFILNDNCLYYFEYTTDKEPRGIIPLENISVYII
uniref:PH domain-containing protein n=1 Tax=Megaselia scalaris TaxID=36166 RepID=T1GMJ1_MEGSC